MLKNSILESEQLISNNIQEMLRMHLGDTVELNFNENLSITQQKAFNLFKKNKNMLIIGPGGTGKSKIIKTMHEYAKKETNKKMYVTSTTGISAYSIGGVTIHSLLGLGTGELDIDALIRKVGRKKLYRERIINTDILVIDEASMLSCELFEKIHFLCQYIRKNNSFFGGIQVIFSMDPMQLLPVFNRNKDLYKNIDERLIVESLIFKKNFVKDNNIIMLTENFRQKNDPTFINLLNRVRIGTFTDDDIKLLNTRKIKHTENSKHVNLVTSNKKAQSINETELEKIKSKVIKYNTMFNSTGENVELKELLTKELQLQFNQKGIVDLVLKKGCRVMLIKNIDVEIGLVNGALGTIIDFVKDSTSTELIPIVEFDNGVKQTIPSVSWEIEIDECIATAKQVPLMLAYSLTIHRSQSQTLESAVLDLSDAFCDAQIYVALSRLCSLETMYLKSFNPKKITVNKIMKTFLESVTIIQRKQLY